MTQEGRKEEVSRNLFILTGSILNRLYTVTDER